MVNKCLVKFGFFCSVFTVFLLSGFPVFAGNYFYKVAAKESPSDLLGVISFRDGNLTVLISSVNYKEFMEYDERLVDSSALLQLMKDLHTASLDAEFNYAMLRLIKNGGQPPRHSCVWMHIEKSKCQFIKVDKVTEGPLDKWFMFNDEFHSAMNESDTSTQGLAKKKVIPFVYVDPFIELLQDKMKNDYLGNFDCGCYRANKEWCLLSDQQQYSYTLNNEDQAWFVRSPSTQLTSHTAGKLEFTCGDWVFIPCAKDEYRQLLKNMVKGQAKEKTSVSWMKDEDKIAATKGKSGRNIINEFNNGSAARFYNIVRQRHSNK